jgi:hypothetical protein
MGARAVHASIAIALGLNMVGDVRPYGYFTAVHIIAVMSTHLSGRDGSSFTWRR